MEDTVSVLGWRIHRPSSSLLSYSVFLCAGWGLSQVWTYLIYILLTWLKVKCEIFLLKYFFLLKFDVQRHLYVSHLLRLTSPKMSLSKHCSGCLSSPTWQLWFNHKNWKWECTSWWNEYCCSPSPKSITI